MAGTKVQERLDALIRRKAELAEALKSQREKKKAIQKQEEDRLCRIVGRVLLEAARKTPDSELMVKSLLKSAIKPDTGEYLFLQQQGWLS